MRESEAPIPNRAGATMSPIAFSQIAKHTLRVLAISSVVACGAGAQTTAPAFGPSNPFYAPSTLPFQAPPFDKIKDSDYQPAIEAGIAGEDEGDRGDREQSRAAGLRQHVRRDGEKRAASRSRPSWHSTRSPRRNTNPGLQKVQQIEAPKLAALTDAEILNPKLFARIEAIYKQRDALAARSGVASGSSSERTTRFIHAGANLSDADKKRLKEINEQLSTLSNAFMQKLLAATKAGAFTTTDKAALAGLTDGQIAAAERPPKARKQGRLHAAAAEHHAAAGACSRSPIARRARRSSRTRWNRAERGDANDTRATIAQLAQLRAQKAKLLGFPNYAAWKLDDQMAKTPEAALRFLDALVPAATAKADARGEGYPGADRAQHGGFSSQPWDWEFYADRCARRSTIWTRRRSSPISS